MDTKLNGKTHSVKAIAKKKPTSRKIKSIPVTAPLEQPQAIERTYPFPENKLSLKNYGTHSDLVCEVFYNEATDKQQAYAIRLVEDRIKREGLEKPKSEKEGADAKREIKRLYKEGKIKEAQDFANQNVNSGLLRMSQINYLFKNVEKNTSPSIYFFRSLPFADKEYLFKQMTDEEKKLYDPNGTLAEQIK